MPTLAKKRNTPNRSADFRQLIVAADKTISAGAMVAVNAEGKAVPASDSAGLTVLGRAENRAGAGLPVTVRAGCFRYANSATAAKITTAEIGKACYVADDQTVSKTGGDNSIVAGIVWDVESKGVWVQIAAGISGAAGQDGDDGQDGADGVSSYTYVAYASDDQGTGFATTPTDLLKYRAEIQVSAPIAEPAVGDFATAVWVKYLA